MGRQGAREAHGARRLAVAAGLALLVLPGAADQGARAAPRELAAAATAGRGLSSFGSFSADASNPSFGAPSSMGMSGVPGAMPMLSPEQSLSVSRESQELVSGMIQAFLGKTELQAGERECLTQGSTQVAGNLGRVAAQVAMVLKSGFGPELDIPGIADTPEEIAAEQALHPQQAFPASGFDFGDMNDGAGDISDIVDQIRGQQTAGGGSQAQPLSLSGLDPVAAPVAPAGPSAAETQAATNSLDLFYGDGRRLQLLPGDPATDMDSGGMGGMGGMGMGGMGVGMASFPVAMELGFSIKQITEETHELMGKCIHSDAKAAFIQAGNNMRNMKYVTGHFLANGADVVRELADSVMAYEKKNLTRFGWDMGLALRKVFLSNSSNSQLPEGMPGDAELSNVTTGMMNGFFGVGSSATIKFDDAPNNPLRVDMHECVKRNSAFFREVWAATLYLYGQEAAKGASELDTEKGKLQFGTQLAFTMMQVPTALRRCNIDPDHQDMITDSLRYLGAGMHLKFQMGGGASATNDELTQHLAKTVKDWSSKNWYPFGVGLGDLMQKMLVRFYPQKYNVDDTGMLRRQLLRLEGAGGRVDVQGASGSVFMPVLLALTVLLLLATLVALKSRRTLEVWRRGQAEVWRATGRGLSVDLEDAQHMRLDAHSAQVTRPLCGAGADDGVE